MRPAGVPDKVNMYPFNPTQMKFCVDYEHFNRIEHPNLGTCAAGEPEGIAGNWQTATACRCTQVEVASIH